MVRVSWSSGPGAGGPDCPDWAGTVGGMDFLVAVAKPWTYWIAPLLVLMAFLGLFSVILQYIFKVVAAKYPKT
jgi:hypothetical protein